MMILLLLAFASARHNYTTCAGEPLTTRWFNVPANLTELTVYMNNVPMLTMVHHDWLIEFSRDTYANWRNDDKASIVFKQGSLSAIYRIKSVAHFEYIIMPYRRTNEITITANDMLDCGQLAMNCSTTWYSLWKNKITIQKLKGTRANITEFSSVYCKRSDTCLVSKLYANGTNVNLTDFNDFMRVLPLPLTDEDHSLKRIVICTIVIIVVLLLIFAIKTPT